MTNTNPARGMRDFLPDQVCKREYVIGIIKEVYEKYGFEPLETPSIENLDTLTNKYGEEGDQLMFKILKRGEKLQQELEGGKIKTENELTDLALRYDLTVPLARVIANNKNDLPKFFKRYQIQPVWRADRPARGRFREFYQCDVDAIGSKSMIVEAELCAAVCEILERLGFDDFQIRINNREVLLGFLEAFNIHKEKKTDVLIAIDKLDKIGTDGVLKEFIERDISETTSKRLIKFFKDANKFLGKGETLINASSDIPDEVKNDPIKISTFLNNLVLNKLEEKLKSSDFGSNGFEDLKEVNNLLVKNEIYKYIRFDPSLARGLSYYTGAIFEVVLTKGDFSGSIAGGGRYDGLIGMFGKEEIPAVGISLGLERILLIMEERGMFPEEIAQRSSADVLVTVWNEETAAESLKLAGELRQKNLRVLVYPEADKLGKQFKYADQIDVQYVCILGDDELKENKVKIKNMKTGEQETVARSEAAEKINKPI